MPNFLARASTRASIISRTTSSDEEPASRRTVSITSWQSAQPALNTSIFPFVAIARHSAKFQRFLKCTRSPPRVQARRNHHVARSSLFGDNGGAALGGQAAHARRGVADRGQYPR